MRWENERMREKDDMRNEMRKWKEWDEKWDEKRKRESHHSLIINTSLRAWKTAWQLGIELQNISNFLFKI